MLKRVVRSLQPDIGEWRAHWRWCGQLRIGQTMSANDERWQKMLLSKLFQLWKSIAHFWMKAPRLGRTNILCPFPSFIKHHGCKCLLLSRVDHILHSQWNMRYEPLPLFAWDSFHVAHCNYYLWNLHGHWNIGGNSQEMHYNRRFVHMDAKRIELGSVTCNWFVSILAAKSMSLLKPNHCPGTWVVAASV